MKKRMLKATPLLLVSALLATPASALNSLQLGPGCDPGATAGCGSWSYVGGGNDTWYHSGEQPFSLKAYANATKAEGGNGDYAWSTVPDPDRYAYLVAASVPDLGDIGDLFDVTITNATHITSGYGTPPIEDPNSVAAHDIFDAYFEIFEFQFDGPLVDIDNTQPPGGDPGKGYAEAFTVSWTDLTAGNQLTGLHFDLFTVSTATGGNRYLPGLSEDRFLVEAFAPYSHDAQSTPPGGGEPPASVPEPHIVPLLAMGLLSIGFVRLRARRAG
jgi:hypothetical protein